MDINQAIEAELCEQSTGCENAGGYRDFAFENGYPHCSVYDWTSSAGDWTFIVSKDGQEWFIMSQENNWPGRGFTREIDTSQAFYGTSDEVSQQIWDMYS